MARSIDLSQYDYVLEADRSKPQSEQTVFSLMSRTVDQVNTDAAANLNRLMIRGKKGESIEKIGNDLTNRQAVAFQEVVLCIKNFKVSKGAPRGFYDKYKDAFQKDGETLIIDTTDPKVIRELYFVLHSDDSAEILEEVDRKSHASEVEKN